MILRVFCTMLFCLVFGCLPAYALENTVEEDFMPQPYVQLQHPEWSRNAAIYQVNVRQFTPEGTFAAAAEQLPRIKELGADIIWLMPVQEIGLKNRKGKLGSPYSIRDYLGVNPEHGDLDSLKQFVKTAHGLDMYVILDWVANHTAWDNPLVEQHPEWYLRDRDGNFQPPRWTDWSDVITLDYQQPGLRRYMADAMKYWVREVGLDGFRCDVAGLVPVEFWNHVRMELDAIRPVFMLAEWDTRDLHARAFDMTYAWDWYEAVHAIAMGKADTAALAGFHFRDENSWPQDAMRMLFVSNHDKNSWEGTQFEMFGEALENAIVLSVVSRGMPLIYNGQEAGNPRRLAFFEKDSISWREHPIGDLYRRLLVLKKENTALWNGHWGAPMQQVTNSAPAQVFSFVRANETSKIFAVFNFSPDSRKVTFEGSLYHGEYHDFTSGKGWSLNEGLKLEMKPWSFRLFVKNGG